MIETKKGKLDKLEELATQMNLECLSNCQACNNQNLCDFLGDPPHIILDGIKAMREE